MPDTTHTEHAGLFYLLVCRDCGDGDLVMPFTSPAERGKWAAEHKATGHDRWIVIGPTDPVYQLVIPKAMPVPDAALRACTRCNGCGTEPDAPAAVPGGTQDAVDAATTALNRGGDVAAMLAAAQPFLAASERARCVDELFARDLRAAATVLMRDTLPAVRQIRAWMTAAGWAAVASGPAGEMWERAGGDPLAVPRDDTDESVTTGLVWRLARLADRALSELMAEVAAITEGENDRG